MDVGAELRHAREQRGFSLEELSRRTKIRPQTLRALEGNQLEHLPAAIFIRGFVKAYALEVGLDPATAWQRYAVQLEPPPQEPDAAEGAHTPEGQRTNPPAGQRVNSPEGQRVNPPGAGSHGRVGQLSVGAYRLAERYRRPVALASLAFLVLLLYAALGRWQTSNVAQPGEAPRPREIVPSIGRPSETKYPAVREVTPTAGAFDAAASAPAGQLRIDLQPPQTCWVSATADGRRVVYRLMRAGERETIEAREQVVLRVGDAARFAFSIGGLPGRPLAPAGQPAAVRITPHNYRAFVGQ